MVSATWNQGLKNDLFFWLRSATDYMILKFSRLRSATNYMMKLRCKYTMCRSILTRVICRLFVNYVKNAKPMTWYWYQNCREVRKIFQIIVNKSLNQNNKALEEKAKKDLLKIEIFRIFFRKKPISQKKKIRIFRRNFNEVLMIAPTHTSSKKLCLDYITL